MTTSKTFTTAEAISAEALDAHKKLPPLGEHEYVHAEVEQANRELHKPGGEEGYFHRPNLIDSIARLIRAVEVMDRSE